MYLNKVACGYSELLHRVIVDANLAMSDIALSGVRNS
jgi:hypothetical protein